MAQQLQTISIEAAGFGGINTQDSPTSIDTSFARKANNCIIDKFGRIGARKGTRKIDSIDATTTLAPVVSAFEFIDPDGNDIFLLSHNNKVYSHVLGGTTTVLTNPIASGGTFPDNHTITTSDWKIISLQDHAFFFSRDQEPLIWYDNGGTYELEPFSSHAHATGNAPYANEAVAAYGRVWAADVTGSKSTVYWTDLLNGHAWSGGTSGSLDLTTVWNTGHDEITALAAHNGFLVIFGRHSIVIYSGAESPASMVLEDVIEGIGCIERDSVQNTGSDIVFLSANGLRSLGRTIQEKSVAIGDLSSNVRDDLLASLDRNTGDVKSVYSPKDGFYLLSIPDEDIVYCFDLKQRLPNGSAKTTTWSQIQPYGFCLDRENNLYIYLVNSGYAAKPHSLTSTPSASACSVTRIPMTLLMMNQAIILVTKVQAKITTIPVSWPINVASSFPEKHTARRPQIPTTPWTDMAPTGSSILILSMASIEKTTRTPPIAPIIDA